MGLNGFFNKKIDVFSNNGPAKGGIFCFYILAFVLRQGHPSENR